MTRKCDLSSNKNCTFTTTVIKTVRRCQTKNSNLQWSNYTRDCCKVRNWPCTTTCSTIWIFHRHDLRFYFITIRFLLFFIHRLDGVTLSLVKLNVAFITVLLLLLLPYRISIWQWLLIFLLLDNFWILIHVGTRILVQVIGMRNIVLYDTGRAGPQISFNFFYF